MKKSLVGVLFICIVCLSLVVPTMSAPTPNVSSAKEWCQYSKYVKFPIDLYETEKVNFVSYKERIDFFQIPDKFIKNITTKNLLDLIMKYPLMCNLYAFDNIQDGYESIKREFNGFNIFLSRGDSLKVAIDAYNNLKIPTNKTLDYNELIHTATYAEDVNKIANDDILCNKAKYDMSVRYECEILELILAELINQKSPSCQDSYSLNLALSAITSKKQTSEYFHDNSCNILLNEIEHLPDNNNAKSILVSDPTLKLTVSNSTFNVYTPNDKILVKCDYSTSTYMDSPEINASYAKAYNAVVVSSAPRSYNCHSFAWLQSLYPKVYTNIWLSSASAFSSDSAYSRENNPSRTGEIAYWGNRSHSAIVAAVSVFNPAKQRPEPQFISKWGTGAIFRHFADNCPYDTGAYGINYYYIK